MKIREYSDVVLSQLMKHYEASEARALLRWMLMEHFGEDGYKGMRMEEFEIADADRVFLNTVLGRLIQQEPIQYIFQRAYFLDLELMVDASVLIPRPETEELVMWMTESAKPEGRLLDIGCGSGCISLGMKSRCPGWEVKALDVSEKAIEVAEYNAVKNELAIEFIQTDILEAGLEQRMKKWNHSFDIIVSNPPYISPEEQEQMPDSVKRFEPHLALFSEDPLAFYRRISELSKAWLKAGGWLFFELSEFRAAEVREILKQDGYTDIQIRCDMQGKERMIRASMP